MLTQFLRNLLHSRAIRRYFFVGGLLGFLLLAAAGWSRKVAYQVEPGVWKTLDESELKYRVQAAPSYTLATGSINWSVSYLDSVGAGFKDAAQGAARRAAVDTVLTYLSTLFDYSGITLDVSFQASQTDGSGFLASAGTWFAIDPAGFQNGVAFDHASTGSDPSPGTEDIYCTVDFGYLWNAGPGDPDVNTYDLPSVLLHEFTHGLGLLSVVNSDGTSQVSHGNPGVFTIWDDFLHTGGGGAALFSTGGVFAGLTSYLTGSDGGLVFWGARATAAFGGRPPIYAPNPFLSGSSIAHWNSGIAGGAVMEPAIGKNVKKRTYRPVDAGALQDIGWRVKVNKTSNWSIYQ